MGPFVVTMPGTALTWTVIGVSLVIGAMLAYEIAVTNPPKIHWPRWPRWIGQTLRFIYRWYPRVVLPLLIALGWLWL